MTIEKKLKEFQEMLLEKEMLMCREIPEDCTNAFYSGAYTWIKFIRHEFNDRFGAMVKVDHGSTPVSGSNPGSSI